MAGASAVMSREDRLEVVACRELDGTRREALHSLFEATYYEANHDYLEASLDVLRTVALAESGGSLVGFALGDAKIAELPGFEQPQTVALAGLSCIDLSARRRGLFLRLSLSAMAANGIVDPSRRFLFATRMAHIIAYRTMTGGATNAVPSPGFALTDWHKAVGVAVAALFGSVLDPDTFVVRGSGEPIGTPKVELSAPEDEATLFAHVDRARGDSLLGLSWRPDVPSGWIPGSGGSRRR